MATINYKPINIGIVPKPGPDKMGLVGMPVWMWVDRPSAQTYGPITASDAEGGVTVRITGRVTDVEWSMGDGTTVICGEGQPYHRSYGKRESPSCGHRYEKTSGREPGKKYTVTARSRWEFTWTADGQTGVITPPMQVAQEQIRVGELQVLQQ